MSRFLSVLFLLTSFFSFGQKEEMPVYREVVIVNTSSTLKFQIKILKQEIKASDKYTYYWYANNQLHSTQGGYDGFLLDGYYKEYNTIGQLIAQGIYKKGLKAGEWKSWYDNGVIKETSNWKNGALCGDYKLYNEKGENVKHYIYSSTAKRDVFAETLEKQLRKEERSKKKADKEKAAKEKPTLNSKEKSAGKKINFKSLFKKKKKVDSPQPSKITK